MWLIIKMRLFGKNVTFLAVIIIGAKVFLVAV